MCVSGCSAHTDTQREKGRGRRRDICGEGRRESLRWSSSSRSRSRFYCRQTRDQTGRYWWNFSNFPLLRSAAFGTKIHPDFLGSFISWILTKCCLRLGFRHLPSLDRFSTGWRTATFLSGSVRWNQGGSRSSTPAPPVGTGLRVNCLTPPSMLGFEEVSLRTPPDRTFVSQTPVFCGEQQWCWSLADMPPGGEDVRFSADFNVSTR